MKPKITKTSKTKTKKSLGDPRFSSRVNILSHLDTYSFLYSNDLTKKVKNVRRRRQLEDFFVKNGKKRWFNGKKQIDELRKMEKSERKHHKND